MADPRGQGFDEAWVCVRIDNSCPLQTGVERFIAALPTLELQPPLRVHVPDRVRIGQMVLTGGVWPAIVRRTILEVDREC
jgi:hypothetical protein